MVRFRIIISTMPIIRNEYRDDFDQIALINELAFGQPTEARLIDALRENGKIILSLVAEANRKVVGHILFSPASIEGNDIKLAALGPMAVLPRHQRHGIGTMLVHDGIALCRTLGYRAIVVVGHPEYYPRFGFKPGSEFGLATPWKDVPPEAFMVLELEPGALQDAAGIVHYAEEFDLAHNKKPRVEARG
jgi:putative acetyltransferase